MKILQLSKYFPPNIGGIESVTYDLAEGLNSRKIHCDVLCSGTSLVTVVEKRDSYKIIRTGRLFEFASTSFSISLPLVLKRIQGEYDVIHVHFPNPMAALALYLCRPNAKIVVHWHSDVIRQRGAYLFFKPLEYWVLSRASAIIVTSANYLKGSDALKKFSAKVVVIPIGISNSSPYFPEQEVNAIKSQYNNRKIIFGLGRLVYYKGFEYLIKSAKYLNDDSVILIGGEGNLKTMLSQLIKKEEVEDKVFLLGRIPAGKLENFFQACDIFCLPSIERSEAFGVVLLEAMRHGKPILATTIPGSGVDWVNQHNFTGLNVPVRNAELLAESIKLLISDHDRYQQLSSNALKRFHECFTVDKMVGLFIELYSSILKRG